MILLSLGDADAFLVFVLGRHRAKRKVLDVDRLVFRSKNFKVVIDISWCDLIVESNRLDCTAGKIAGPDILFDFVHVGVGEFVHTDRDCTRVIFRQTSQWAHWISVTCLMIFATLDAPPGAGSSYTIVSSHSMG